MAQIEIDLGRERARSWEGARVATWGRFGGRRRIGRRIWRLDQGDGALLMPVASWRDRTQGFRASPIGFR